MNGPEKEKGSAEPAFLTKRLRELDRDIPVPAAARAEYLKSRISQPARRSFPRWRPALGAASLAVVAMLGIFLGSRLMPGGAGFTASPAGFAETAAQVAPEASMAEAALCDETAVEEAAEDAKGRPNEWAAESYGEIRSRILALEAEFFRYGQDLAIAEDSGKTASPSASSPALQNGLSYGTNVQTKGVDEADIVKTDGKYLYYLRTGQTGGAAPALFIVEAKSLSLVSSIPVDSSATEFFLSGRKLALLKQSYDGMEKLWGGLPVTAVELYDLSDPSTPQRDCVFRQEGRYLSSRLSGGILYLVTQKDLYQSPSDLSDEELVPRIWNSALDAEPEPLDPGCIALPEQMSQPSYTVVSSLPLAKPEEASTQSALGGGDTVYMSSENLYTLGSVWRAGPAGEAQRTCILKFSLSGGQPVFSAEALLPGWPDDQFSADEYGGYFRIALTCAQDGETQNSLYILDQRLEPVGKVQGLAPGETIRAVRFMGGMAYVVTFRQTDPLFAIDLSDPENPRVTGQVKLPGFSEYLHPVSGALMLGFGYDTDTVGNSRSLKLSLFDLSDPESPRELDQSCFGGPVSFSPAIDDHRAFLYLDAQKLAGFPVTLYEEASGGIRFDFNGLLLYRVSKDGLIPAGALSHMDAGGDKDAHDSSGLYIERGLTDGRRLYTISEELIRAYSLDDLSVLRELVLPR